MLSYIYTDSLISCLNMVLTSNYDYINCGFYFLPYVKETQNIVKLNKKVFDFFIDNETLLLLKNIAFIVD